MIKLYWWKGPLTIEDAHLVSYMHLSVMQMCPL